MPNLRFSLLILMLSACFMPFVSFTLLELIIGATAGLGAIGIANFLSAVRPTETPTGLDFNPREWPKYIAVGIIQTTGYFLYHRIGHAEVGSGKYVTSIIFIAIIVAIPALILFILLVRNRNDRITLTGQELKWQDNHTTGTIDIGKISSIRAVQAQKVLIIPNHHLLIELQNNEQTVIPVHQMNFTWRDTQRTAKTIQSMLSK